MTNIALADVMVIWKPHKFTVPPIKVVERPADGDGPAPDDDENYLKSWGACSSDFSEASNEQRIRMLLSLFIELTIVHGIDVDDVHEEFLVIPEYRAILPAILDPQRVS